MAAPRPERAGEFLLLSELHASATTEVWTAIRPGDAGGQLLVLKRPRVGERASGPAAQAVEREADALRAAPGPRAPELVASGKLGGLPFVVTALVDGTSLRHLGTRALAAPALGRLATELARALGDLHAKGRIHGDVAPSNVIVSEGGDVALVDYGASVAIGEPRLPAGQPGYAAPEVLRDGAASPAQDVYGLAAIVAELAIGERLFPEGKLVEAANRGAAPSAVAEIPEIGTLLVRALDRSPDARPTIAELIEAFGRLPSDGAALAAWTAERAALATRPTLLAADIAGSDAASRGRGDVDGWHEPRPTLHEAPRRPDSAREIVITPRLQASAPSRPPPRSPRIVLLLGGVALAGVLAGGIVGRFLGRPRSASAIVGVTPPPRVLLEIDGKAVTPERRLENIQPGAHTLTVRWGRERREVPIRLEGGERLVLLPLTRSTTPTLGIDD